jgi:hypothetical protein
MSFSKHIDKMIGEAIARGEFENLEGEGKPIDLDAYFATPQELRIGYSVLKSSKFVPEEIDRMKEIGEIKEKLASCPEEDIPKLTKQLRERELALALILERNKRRK